MEDKSLINVFKDVRERMAENPVIGVLLRRCLYRENKGQQDRFLFYGSKEKLPSPDIAGANLFCDPWSFLQRTALCPSPPWNPMCHQTPGLERMRQASLSTD